MATLEDKILGEKLHNYCSSSSSGEDSDSDSEKAPKKSEAQPADLPSPNKWEGTSTNTGPKGVIKDWQRYKQLEIEKRSRDTKEVVALAKKLTMTVSTALDEEKEHDQELEDLSDDVEFLAKYRKERMLQMMQQHSRPVRKFGSLLMLQDASQFLAAIDEEHQSTKIIVHIYEENIEACRTMNKCLKQLCPVYENVKFCAILGGVVGMTADFKANGVPTLLVYKADTLIGNFVKLTTEFGNNFLAEDVQGFLVEHGMLEDKSFTPAIIKENADSSDSD